MSTTIAKRGDVLSCPYCGESEGEPVEDYVVPKSYRPWTERCVFCDKKFTVTERRETKDFEIWRDA